MAAIRGLEMTLVELRAKMSSMVKQGKIQNAQVPLAMEIEKVAAFDKLY